MHFLMSGFRKKAIDIFYDTLEEFKVNPNTMQKALVELEEGLIYTERTNGKFVTNDVNLLNKHKFPVLNDNVEVKRASRFSIMPNYFNTLQQEDYAKFIEVQ